MTDYTLHREVSAEDPAALELPPTEPIDITSSVQHEHLPPARSRYTFPRWQVRSTLPKTADLDDHLAQLWDRASESLERAVRLPEEVVRYLDIVRYYDVRAFQSHGINIPRHWIGLLGRIGAEVDVDLHVLRDGPNDDWPNP